MKAIPTRHSVERWLERIAAPDDNAIRRESRAHSEIQLSVSRAVKIPQRYAKPRWTQKHVVSRHFPKHSVDYLVGPRAIFVVSAGKVVTVNAASENDLADVLIWLLFNLWEVDD